MKTNKIYVTQRHIAHTHTQTTTHTADWLVWIQGFEEETDTQDPNDITPPKEVMLRLHGHTLDIVESKHSKLHKTDDILDRGTRINVGLFKSLKPISNLT